jgi:hypothetical protein
MPPATWNAEQNALKKDKHHIMQQASVHRRNSGNVRKTIRSPVERDEYIINELRLFSTYMNYLDRYTAYSKIIQNRAKLS